MRGGLGCGGSGETADKPEGSLGIDRKVLNGLR